MRQKTRKVLRLRKLRRDREMSQNALGDLVGLDKSTIALIESGARKPSLDKARALAHVFGESIESLFEEVEVPR